MSRKSDWWHQPIKPTRRNQAVVAMLGGAVPALAIGLPFALARDADMRLVGRIAVGLGLVLAIAALALLRLGPRN